MSVLRCGVPIVFSLYDNRVTAFIFAEVEKYFYFDFSIRTKISFDIIAEQYMTNFRNATQLSHCTQGQQKRLAVRLGHADRLDGAF